MAIFKLSTSDLSSPDAQLSRATITALELEANLERWLENSPTAIAQVPLLIIERQAVARADSDLRYPDLLALDQYGNLVIIELKKNRTPREVVAQILEYAAWAKELSSDDVINRLLDYRRLASLGQFRELFFDTFEVEAPPNLNGGPLRLFIAAEEIEKSVHVRVAS